MITHPDKVLFPDDGITKGELAAYYEAIAPVMLPHIRARPVTMERYPAGIGKKGFLQKDVSKGFPDWLERVEVPKKGGTVHHPLVCDTRSLLWLANQNSITPHVWTSRAPKLYQPDICVFDLDPSAGRPGVLRAAALAPPRSAERARPAQLGQDVRLEGVSHRRPARRQGRLRRRRAVRPRRRAAPRHPRSGAPDPGVQQGRPRRPHSRRHRAQRLQRDVRRGLRRARQARRARVRAVHLGRARTRRGCARGRSRCGRWPTESRRSAICGRTCAGAGDRFDVRWSSCEGC